MHATGVGVLLAVLLFSAAARGALLENVAVYRFAEGARTSADMHAASVASSITDGKGFSGEILKTEGVPAPCLYVNGKETENTTAESLKDGDYWEFTVTPLFGELDYQSLAFHSQAAAHPKYSGGMELNLGIYTSLDNFAAPIRIHTERAEEQGVSDFSKRHKVDLTSLPGSSSPVTFRIVVWDSSKTEAKQNRIDSIVLTALDKSSVPPIEGVRYSYPDPGKRPNHPNASDPGKRVLTDGVTSPGAWLEGDDRWVGVLRKGGSPLMIRFDLGLTRTVSRIRVRYLNGWESGISGPTEVQLRFSVPGKDATQPVTLAGIPAEQSGPKTLVINVDDVAARFVDMTFRNWTGGWTFLSEVTFEETPVGRVSVVGGGQKKRASGPIARLYGPREAEPKLPKLPDPPEPEAAKPVAEATKPAPKAAAAKPKQPAPKPVAKATPKPPAKASTAAAPPKSASPGPVRAKVTASSTNQGSSPKRVMDGDNGTFWISKTGPSSKNPQWIRISFDRPVALKGFALKGAQWHAPCQSAMQVSDDGKTYATLKSKRLANGELWKETFFPVTTRFVRFRFSSSYSNKKPTQAGADVRVAEIKLTGAKSPQAEGGR